MQLSSVSFFKNGHAHFDNNHSQWNTILKSQYKCNYLINSLGICNLQYPTSHAK